MKCIIYILLAEETAFVKAVLIFSHFYVLPVAAARQIQQCATTIRGCEAQGLMGMPKDGSLYIINVASPSHSIYASDKRQEY